MRGETRSTAMTMQSRISGRLLEHVASLWDLPPVTAHYTELDADLLWQR